MNSAMARFAILNRIRQKSGNIPDSPDIAPDMLANEPEEQKYLLNKFCSELDLLGVEYHIENSESGVREKVGSLIAGQKLIAWEVQHLPYGVGDLIKEEDVIANSETVESRAQAEIGITGCDAAIEETGTLALISSPQKPRTASLLPYTHIAIVRQDQILLNLGEFFRKFKNEMSDSSCLNLVTGPSRTADIELQLTLGVHGPGKMIIIIGP